MFVVRWREGDESSNDANGSRGGRPWKASIKDGPEVTDRGREVLFWNEQWRDEAGCAVDGGCYQMQVLGVREEAPHEGVWLAGYFFCTRTL